MALFIKLEANNVMPDLLARKETIATKVAKTQRENSLTFFLALLLFLAATIAYGGLILLSRAQVSARDELTSQIEEKEKNLRPELIQQIFTVEERLKNLNTLLNKHIFNSNVFSAIESDTHPQVRFTSFNFSPDTRKVDMAGETISYAILSQQVNLLERDPLIEHVEFGGLALTGNNTLGFRTTITFRPAVFQERPEATGDTTSLTSTSTTP